MNLILIYIVSLKHISCQIFKKWTFSPPLLPFSLMTPYRAPSGGAFTLERGMGMCRGHDPLFSGLSPLPSLPIYRQCAALVTPVFNFKKLFEFSDIFWPKFSLSRSTQIFPNFRSQDPHFSRKIRSLRPYISTF